MKTIHDRIQICPKCGAHNQERDWLGIALHNLTEHEHRDMGLSQEDACKVLEPGIYREWGWGPELN